MAAFYADLGALRRPHRTYGFRVVVFVAGTLGLGTAAHAGCALSFDGTNDLVTCGAVASLREHTVEAWVRPGSANTGAIVAQNTGSGPACGEGIILYGGAGPLCYDLNPQGCGSSNIVCQEQPTVDRWAHVAGTYDGTLGRLYVDGQLVGELDNVSFPTTRYLRFGTYYFFSGGEDSYFSGEADEIRIWNHARSDQEIRATMFCAPPTDAVGLVGYWPMDDCAGQTVADASPTGRSCVLGTTAAAQSSDPIWDPSNAPLLDQCGGTCAEGLCIASFAPTVGGDTGTVSVRISGVGFQPGATASLVRADEQPIAGNVELAGTGETALVATFDLRGKVRGGWNIRVANSDGSSVTDATPFTIEPGRAPALWIEILGRDTIRGGRAQRYSVVYGNTGNVDAHDLHLDVRLPRSVAVDVDLPHPETPEFDWDAPDSVEIDDQQSIAVWQAKLGAGTTTGITFRVTASADSLGETVPISAQLSPVTSDFAESGDIDDVRTSPTFEAFSEAALQTLAQLGTPQPPEVVRNSLFDRIKHWWDVFFPKAEAIGLGVGRLLGSGLVEAGGSVAQQFVGAIEATRFYLLQIHRSLDVLELVTADLRPRVVNSLDPNDKIGPRGAGAPLYVVPADQPLYYEIFFENVATASAPAQQVVIVDELDTEALDVATLELHHIQFGRRVVRPVPDSTRFTTSVDLGPEQNIIVKVTADLDEAAGVLTWTLSAIDPTTGQPPDDPLAGFLPPNVTPPEGDGSVAFAIRPRASVGPGTTISNHATITFDQNAPIATPTWINTIAGPPSTTTTTLVAACVSAADCDDGDPCTDDRCEPGGTCATSLRAGVPGAICHLEGLSLADICPQETIGKSVLRYVATARSKGLRLIAKSNDRPVGPKRTRLLRKATRAVSALRIEGSRRRKWVRKRWISEACLDRLATRAGLVEQAIAR